MSTEVNEPAKPVVDPVGPEATPAVPEDQAGLLASRDAHMNESKKKDGIIKEQAEKLSKFENAIEEQKTKTLEEQQEYQKLYQEEKEKSSLKDKANRKLQRENLASGFKNKDLIHSFKDKFVYEDGIITNGKEVMEGLFKDEPYLFESNQQPISVLGMPPRIGEHNLSKEDAKKKVEDDFLDAVGGKKP